MTTVFNLYGGPGTGKSTSAAYLYYLLKSNGVNAELVREYVKDWAWEGRKFSAYDQLYFLGKQIRKESMLFDKVDSIVTDSPVMLGVYYAERFSPIHVAQGVRQATLSYYKQSEEDGIRHVHVMLRRSKTYNPAGRYQTEAEAMSIDLGIECLLNSLEISYLSCGTDESSLKGLMAWQR